MMTRRQLILLQPRKNARDLERFTAAEIAKAFMVPAHMLRGRHPVYDHLRALEEFRVRWMAESVRLFLGRWTMARQRLQHVEFIRCVIGDCGCPEEEYLFNGVDLIVHYDPDGTADAHMDWGDDGEAETTVEGMSRFAARHAVFAWAASLTTERGGRVT